MQLIIGGAFSGKRNFVRTQFAEFELVSSYKEDHYKKALSISPSTNVLVIEGFEEWIQQKINKVNNHEIRLEFNHFFKSLLQREEEEYLKIILIMLEMGRGIVPVVEEERNWRDISGWVAQDAQKHCNEVYYIWHGIAKKMK